MKNEDRMVELLAELVIKQDQMLGEMKMFREDIHKLWQEQNKTNILLKSHENDLIKIADLLGEGVPRYDQVMRLEHLDENRIVLKKD